MKKTIYKYIVLAALVCICASCQKGLEEVQEGGLTVTATIAGGGNGSADGTKVLAEDTGTALKLKWEVGDIVFGFDDDNNTYSFKVASIDDGKATLKRIAAGSEKGTAKTDPANGTKMYLFYAPGKKAADIDFSTAPASPSLTVDISTQAKDVVPVLMTSTGTVTDGALALDFQVRTALIGIKTPTMAVASQAYTAITLSASAGTVNTLNTKVTFSKNGDNIAASYDTPGEINKTVDFTTSNPVVPISDIIYIAACPMNAESSLTFTMNNGEVLTKTGKKLEEGKYYYMTPEFFVPREIEVSFLEATSSVFIQEDGTTAVPNGFMFVGGEKIKVANGVQDPEECTVTVDGTGKATITTLLPGELTAIFPATKAVVNGKEISVEEDNTVQAAQDGTLAGAIVSKATIAANGTSASFENQNATSVFRIDIPEGATKLTVRSLKAVTRETRYSTSILEPISRSGDEEAINTEGGTAAAKAIITVTPASGTLTGPCFIRLKPGVKFSDLAFDVMIAENTTDNVSGSMKGIPERYIKGFNSKTNVRDNNFDTNNTTEAGKVYTIGLDNWHYYVKIGNYKWATMNIGATALTGIDSYGYYFAWAEVRGHKLDPTKDYTTSTTSNAFQKDFTDFGTNGYNADKRYYYPEGGTNTRWSSGSGFDNAGYRTPYNNGDSSSWWKYTDSKSLELMDDAAYYNWGGPWEVPGGKDTDSPYKQLVSSATYVTKPSGSADFTNNKAWILTRVVTPKIKLSFPAAGYGYNGATFGSAGSYLCSWCKEHYSSSSTSSYALYVYSSNCTSSSTSQISSSRNRYEGYTIRPVSAY